MKEHRITIEHDPRAPLAAVQALRDRLSDITPDVHVAEATLTPQASLDWALPAAVALLIGTALVDGFLRELGSNGAQKIKEAIAVLFRRVKTTPVTWIVSSPSRVPKTVPSINITLMLEDSERCHHGVQFILLDSLDRELLLRALDAIPAEFESARKAEQDFVETIRGAFLGTRVTSYVYLPELARWMELANALRRSRTGKHESVMPMTEDKAIAVRRELMQALYDKYMQSPTAQLIYHRDDVDPDFAVRRREAEWLEHHGLIAAKFGATGDFGARLTVAGRDFMNMGGPERWSGSGASSDESVNSAYSARTYQGAEAPIDLAILTAIEVERKAVCTALGFGKDQRVKKGGRWYWRGQLHLADGSAYQIVVAQPADMGQVEATGLTKDVLHDWKPAAALLVGIAASTDGSKVRLGDVVVGKSVWYYEQGKVTPKGAEPQPEMIPADAGFLKHFAGLADWDETVCVERPDGMETTPTVHHGVIASGEKVIADVAARDHIAAGQRRIIAIAMEDYGFSRAISQSPERVQHLVIRGICDDGTSAKDDRWHRYAAAAAAAFAKHFLLDRPLEPRGRPEPLPLRPSPASGTSMRCLTSLRTPDVGPVLLSNEQRGARAVSVDDENVYWATKDAIMCLAKKYGASRRLATANAFSIVVDDTSIYWTEDDKIMTVATTGTQPPFSLVDDQNNPTHLAVDDHFIYWTNSGSRSCDGEVKRISKTLGTPATRFFEGGPKVIADGLYGPGSIAVDATHVYWTNWKAGPVMKAPKGGGPSVELAPGRSYQAYGGLVVDEKNVYWTAQDQKTTANGALMKAPISGEPHYPLAAGQVDPGDVVVDLRNVYWVAGHSILRVAKTGGAVTILVTEDEPVGGLAIDDASIYWTVPNDGAVWMMLK